MEKRLSCLNRNVKTFIVSVFLDHRPGNDTRDDFVDMVKLLRILLFLFVLRLQEFVGSFQSVVIVNNKQMTYNRKGELVEVEKVADNKLKGNPVEVVEKSNIFKTSAFVTNSNFKGGNTRFNSGLITKSNLTRNWYLPTRSHLTSRRPSTTQRPKVYRVSSPTPEYQTVTVAMTSTPSPVSTAIFLNDEITSVENSLHNTYDELFNHYSNNPPVTDRPKPVESTHEKPMLFIYSTPSPTTIVPVFNVMSSTKKPKRKKKKPTSTAMPIHDHFMQNLDYYRKILMLNCSTTKNDRKFNELTTEPAIVQITPKPKPIVKKIDEHVSLIEKLKPTDHLKLEEGKKDKKKKKKKCKKKKKKHGETGHKFGSHHEVHEHIHYHDKDKKKHGNKHKYDHHQDHYHSKEDVIYYEPSLEHVFDKAGIFSTFYSFFEDALTSKEFLDYGKHHGGASDSESAADYVSDHSGFLHHRKKRSTDSKLKKVDLMKARKSMTTKIKVTSEYDDSSAGQTTTLTPAKESITKKPPKIKRPKIESSEESDEEYTLYDQIMGVRDDDSGESGDRIDSEEYYDEPATNRLPEGDSEKNKVEDYSEENENASDSMFSGVTNMFSTFGNFLSSLTGYGDTSRAPPQTYDDYEDEGRSTTEKVEQQSKRPKRENEPLAWYQPSFLFLSDNDDEKAFSSTTHANWLQSPWQQMDDDENEITTEFPATTTTERPLTSTTEEPSYNFLEKVSQYLNPARQEIPKHKPKIKHHRKKYDDYQLWRITPKSKDETNFIEDFKMSLEGEKVHWLKGPMLKGTADVVVPPDYVEVFQDFLSDNEIKFDVKVRDIQHAIQYENPRLNKRDQIELEVVYGHPLTWYRYHPYKDIQSYFDFLKRKFADYVELIPIGWSFEGRPLTIVKVSHAIRDKANDLMKEHRSEAKKPAIFIQSGAEAHEWLPIACSTFILNNLVENIEINSTVGDMIRKVNWYIMPVLNPDGYDYSVHYDRLWQKTRSKHFTASDMWSTAYV